jgi:hypothetical protein
MSRQGDEEAMAAFICTMVVSAAALASVCWLSKRLLWLEIVGCWAFIAAAEQFAFIVLTLNLKYIELKRGILSFSTIKQLDLIIAPVVTLWYLAVVGNEKVKWHVKIVTTVAAALALTSINGLFRAIGLITFIHWSLDYCTVLFLAVLSLSWAFMAFYRYFMRRDGIHR